MLNKKFASVLNYLKIKDRAHKKNPRMHSRQQTKKAVLTTATYFKVAETKFHYSVFNLRICSCYRTVPKCNMGNIFRVSHIPQLISRAFRPVK